MISDRILELNEWLYYETFIIDLSWAVFVWEN